MNHLSKTATRPVVFLALALAAATGPLAAQAGPLAVRAGPLAQNGGGFRSAAVGRASGWVHSPAPQQQDAPNRGPDVLLPAVAWGALGGAAGFVLGRRIAEGADAEPTSYDVMVAGTGGAFAGVAAALGARGAGGEPAWWASVVGGLLGATLASVAHTGRPVLYYSLPVVGAVVGNQMGQKGRQNPPRRRDARVRRHRLRWGAMGRPEASRARRRLRPATPPP